MGLIASAAGISRATLYKYFPGVDEIVIAAHAGHVASHLAALEAARSCASTPGEALTTLLDSYGRICAHRRHHLPLDVDALVHAGAQHARHRSAIRDLLTCAITEAQVAGQARDDLDAPELASVVEHAMSAATDVQDDAALSRLISLVSEMLHLDQA